jgi:hypothetical protein
MYYGNSHYQNTNNDTLKMYQNTQNHVHEIQGSVDIAEPEEDPHSHRFSAISGEAVPDGADHYHEIVFATDFHNEHYHKFYGRTSGSIPVGGNKHVHYLEAETTVNDQHSHNLRFATLIDDPNGH